jgi:hypothetical protein
LHGRLALKLPWIKIFVGDKRALRTGIWTSDHSCRETRSLELRRFTVNFKSDRADVGHVQRPVPNHDVDNGPVLVQLQVEIKAPATDYHYDPTNASSIKRAIDGPWLKMKFPDVQPSAPSAADSGEVNF